MNPSLQPFRRLRAFPSGKVGPFDSRPFARLASPRAALGQIGALARASRDSVSAANIGGSSSRCNRVEFCRGARSRPPWFTGIVAGHVILGGLFWKAKSTRQRTSRIRTQDARIERLDHLCALSSGVIWVDLQAPCRHSAARAPGARMSNVVRQERPHGVIGAGGRQTIASKARHVTHGGHKALEQTETEATKRESQEGVGGGPVVAFGADHQAMAERLTQSSNSPLPSYPPVPGRLAFPFHRMDKQEFRLVYPDPQLLNSTAHPPSTRLATHIPWT